MPQTQRRILVADNDRAFGAALAEALVAIGHTTLISSRGDEVMRLALAELPDLILIDLRLAETNGLKVAGCLARNAQTCNVPVLLTAGISPHEREPWQEVLDGCGWHVLFKPFRLEELLDAVRRSLAPRPE